MPVEDIECPETGVTGGCEGPCVCWELSLGSSTGAIVLLVCLSSPLCSLIILRQGLTKFLG